MRNFTRLLLSTPLFLFSLIPAYGGLFDLRWDKLAAGFDLVPDADKQSVDEVVKLIRNGEHVEALKRLAELNGRNPDNSSLRILTSYAMIQVGNVVGAFEQADLAHEAPNGNSYKCWFYSKIALLSGKPAVCKRELGHVKKVGDMPREVKELEAELKKMPATAGAR